MGVVRDPLSVVRFGLFVIRKVTKLKLQGSGVRVNSVSSGLLPISSLVALDGTGNQNTSSVTQVWTYNETTGKNELKTVNHVFKNNDPELTYLTLESKKGSSELITTTPEHPFYVSSMVENTQGVGPPQPSRPKPLGHADLNVHWVGAGHLEIGDKIRTADGSSGIVLSVVNVVQARVMFNLEVDRNHDFFVGENAWLVHNVIVKCPNVGTDIVNGRNTINHELAGTSIPLPANLQRNGVTSITFNSDGYPDFSPVATNLTPINTVKLPPGQRNRGSDFADSDKLARIKASFRKTNDLTWHHHEDGVTMILVPRDVHASINHTGGVATTKP